MLEPSARESILKRARRVELKSRRLVARALSGSARSVFRGSGIEFDSVREYCYGDDVRAIDWNVTARASRPFIKQFVTTRERDILVVLDRSSSLAFGSRGRTKAEVALELLAVIAFIAGRGRERIGLAEIGVRDGVWVEPRRGVEWPKRLTALALEPTDGDDPIDWNALGLRLSQALKQSALLFLISDFQELPDVLALRRIAFRHEVVAARIHDPRELELDGSHPIHCVDRELGRSFWLDPGSERERHEFRAAAREHRLATERAFDGASVDRFDLSTVDERFESFFQFLERRRRGVR